MSFQNRKSLLDYVKESLDQAGRQSYFQRVVVITKFLESVDEDVVLVTLKKIYKKYEAMGQEKLCGLMLFYSGYSVHMFEGSETSISEFLQQMAEHINSLFEDIKCTLIANNINQLFFKTMLWRKGEPSMLIEIYTASQETETKRNALMLTTKIYELCNHILDDMKNKDFDKNSDFLDDNYSKFLPEKELIESLLECPLVPSLPQIASLFRVIPIFSNYDELTWPVPFDFLSHNVFSDSKYEVNLTFPDGGKTRPTTSDEDVY